MTGCEKQANASHAVVANRPGVAVRLVEGADRWISRAPHLWKDHRDHP
jgi:hypothetical protein